MLFALWGSALYRSTRDLDFTGYGSSEETDVIAALREVCATPGQEEELIFDVATLAAEPIRDESEYLGLRVRFVVRLHESRIPMQIDVGFGNAIEPEPQDVEYPTLLDDPPPRIRAYPPEAVIAEKFHAMVVIGEPNSRLKDFYDLYVLARRFPFLGERLARAIAATFERRRTAIDAAQPAALAPRFFADVARATRWRTYLTRNVLPGAPADFDAVGELLRSFLGPPWNALATRDAFAEAWAPGGPWHWQARQTRIGPHDDGTPPASRSRRAAPARSQPRRANLEPGTARAGGGVVSGARKERGGTSLPWFKPYSAYKDSGVEWLGEIPAHWEVTRTKFAARLRSGHTPSRQHPEYWQDCTIPWFGLADVWQIRDGRTEYVAETAEKISKLGLANSAARLLPKGTVILSRTASVGFPAILGVDMATTQDFVNWVCGPALRPEYLLNVFRSMQHEFRRLTMGSTHQTIYMPDAGAFCTPMPPISEQDRIVAFVREHTQRIDALVVKKERLIELLQEQRTALITRAVTKGLDPNVPMKGSGVEWLGEIPAHWEVKPFTKYVVEKSDYRGKTPEKVVSGVFLVTARNVRMGLIDYECSQEFVAQDEYDEIMRRGLPRKGDVLFTTEAPLGNVALIDREDVALAQRIIRFRMNAEHFDSRFTLFGMMSDYFQAQLLCLSTGSTAEGLKASKLPMLRLVAPPLTDQYVIVELLDRETARIDTLVAKVRDAIDRLKELRTALISATVTGKIDVREAATT
jgi:type I restriction enzyme S subunit